MSRPRVLFVDDEPAVLAALRNVLRRRRDQWDTEFALGGEAALEVLARDPVDVVVTDMSMPGIDGPRLLTIVKERYPHAARMVLSGQASREAVMRVVPLAHQFLSKPCPSDVLVTALERACQLQPLLVDVEVRGLVGALHALPSPPDAYWALTTALQNPETGLAQLAAIVEREPAMAAKVLQMVNSAFFGARAPVTSILDAVRYLGTDVLSGLLLGAQIFAAFDRSGAPSFSIERLRDRSLHAASVARRLAAPAEREAVYASTLLCDIGQLVMNCAAPVRFEGVLAAARATATPQHASERQEFGVSHAEVGAHLLGLWGLPFPLMEAVAFHHRPAAAAGAPSATLALVHAVCELVDAAAEGRDATLDLPYLAGAGCEAELPHWHAVVAESDL